ncbi:hypothetical protein EMIT0196P_80256 [Pseudomonas chlororaphis]
MIFMREVSLYAIVVSVSEWKV